MTTTAKSSLHLELMHDWAMGSYDLFQEAKEAGDHILALCALRMALEHEIAALQRAKTQPTRGVLARSAASLAFLLGRVTQAHDLLRRGLEDQPPPHSEIAAEMRELQQNPPSIDPAIADALKRLDIPK